MISGQTRILVIGIKKNGQDLGWEVLAKILLPVERRGVTNFESDLVTDKRLDTG